MKLAALLLSIVTTTCSGIEIHKPKFYGETYYSKQYSESLKTSLNAEYRITLHQPKTKKYCLYIGGKINTDLDHFGNDFKTNVFTTLGFDF